MQVDSIWDSPFLKHYSRNKKRKYFEHENFLPYIASLVYYDNKDPAFFFCSRLQT